jgi:hypothetical protein
MINLKTKVETIHTKMPDDTISTRIRVLLFDENGMVVHVSEGRPEHLNYLRRYIKNEGGSFRGAEKKTTHVDYSPHDSY